jgi:hypothetical protein
MLKSIAILLVASALGGCATSGLSSREILPENSFVWDGLGDDPSQPVRPRRTAAIRKPTDPVSSMASMRDDDPALAAAPKYSKEWVARYAAEQVMDDAKLAQVLVICRGC